MKSRLILRFSLYFVIPIAIAFLLYSTMRSYFIEPIAASDQNQIFIDIEPGASFKEICRIMADQNLVKHWRVLDIIGRLKGGSVQIKSGEYTFSRSMTPTEIFEHLGSGKDYKHEIKIEAGMNLYDVAHLIELLKINLAFDFLKAASDRELLVRAGLQTKTFEGYFGEGTYLFAKKAKLSSIIWQLFERADKNWTILQQQKARQLNLSRNEVLAIASLIQKEVQNPAQYFAFSGLIQNRIRAQRKLELESSLRYALHNYRGTLSDAVKANRSPFNTFYYTGLPPGPICIPSEAAISAALEPEINVFQEFTRNDLGQLIFK